MAYVCSDCKLTVDDYAAIATHVRTLHSREPLCGEKIQVGDLIRHGDNDVRVLEVLPDGRLWVQPVTAIRFSVEARIWQAQGS